MYFLKPQILLCVVGLSSFSVVLIPACPIATRGLFGTDWILSKLEEYKFSAAEQEVFQPKLASTGLTLGHAINQHGSNNTGIYTVSGEYKGHSGDMLLVKVLHVVWEGPLGEAFKALKLKGQFIAAGMLKLRSEERPAIVMAKQPGEVLSTSREYKSSSEAEQLKMRTQAIKLMCKAVAKETVEKKIYYADNNMGNALVKVQNKKVVSVVLVDYGGDYVYNVAPGVTKEAVEAYCSKMAPAATWK